jgi:hypothetical protein
MINTKIPLANLARSIGLITALQQKVALLQNDMKYLSPKGDWHEPLS